MSLFKFQLTITLTNRSYAEYSRYFYRIIKEAEFDLTSHLAPRVHREISLRPNAYLELIDWQ